jgi:lysophospholipase L1-like esterase
VQKKMQMSKPISTLWSRKWMSVMRRPRNQYLLLSLLLLSAMLVYFKDDVLEDAFQSPFCDPDGTCHEKPDQPSPRTIYSAKSKDQYEQWWSAHAALNNTAQHYSHRRAHLDHPQKRPLILFGDSITESWAGTNMQLPVPRTAGIPEIFQQTLASDQNRLDPLVLAIGGDQTQHLLYRLKHGQLLPAYANDSTAVFCVLIGTNNLGSGELPGPTVKGILAVVEYLMKNTKGHLLLLKLLPRGDGFRLGKLCPPRCSSSGKPFASFMPAVRKANDAITEGLGPLKQKYGSNRIELLDCGSRFLSNDTNEVESSLMPDFLHPNAEGHKILAECLLSSIKTIPT